MSSATDMKAAKATDDGFIGLIKVSVPVIILITAVVVVLVA